LKSRSFWIGSAAFLLVSMLAACGGGGGGGTPSTGPTPTLRPTPTPTPTPNPYGCVGSSPFAVTAPKRLTAYPPHPIASGDAFTYGGSIASTLAVSAPCPQPTATSSATVTANVSNLAASSFPGGAPAGATTDQRSIESDAFPTVTDTTTTDLALSVANPGNFDLYAQTSSDGSGDSVATAYTNAQVLDELPETTGAAWTNGPQGTLKETLADGTTVSRTISGDGSYVDTESYPDGGTAVITVNGKADGKTMDGSGSYNFDGGTLLFSYAAPSGGNITLTLSSKGNPSKTRTFPVWYPQPLPASYVADDFADNGAQAFDSHCSVNTATYGTTGNQIVETNKTIDPVVGYIETRTTTSYVVNGYGAVCVKIDDAVDSYYQYNSDTTKIDYQSPNGQPIQTSDVVEYLGMTSPSSPLASVRTDAASGVSPVEVASRIAAIESMRELQLAQHLEAVYRAHVLAGGVQK
jgi:hypothetical protein